MNQKIKSQAEIKNIAENLKQQGKTIVTTNGSFDLLHANHVYLLEEAKKQGDILIVGLNSDASVKKYKSPDRPIINQEDRVYMLTALACVDYVVIFDEDLPIEFLKAVKPHIHCKANDYTLPLPESPIVEENGGKVVLIPKREGPSTTDILKKILKIFKDKDPGDVKPKLGQ